MFPNNYWFFFFLLVIVSPAILQEPILVGGYNEISPDRFPTLEEKDPAFVMANDAAHSQFEKKYRSQLGDYVQLFYQVIAGIRYKIYYESDLGYIEVTVEVVYWKKKVTVTEIRILKSYLPPEVPSESLNQTQSLNATNSSDFLDEQEALNSTEIATNSSESSNSTAEEPLNKAVSVSTAQLNASSSSSAIEVATVPKESSTVKRIYLRKST